MNFDAEIQKSPLVNRSPNDPGVRRIISVCLKNMKELAASLPAQSLMKASYLFCKDPVVQEGMKTTKYFSVLPFVSTKS